MESRMRIGLGALLLAGVVAVAYLPAIPGDFVWDDGPYVTENALLRAPDGLWRIWFDLGATIQYYPLVFTTFFLEYSLWGLNPHGYHVVNILLHALNAILLWLVLRRLSVPGAWFASLIFALHPVHVESVAWITQRKNVLSCAFALLSVLAFDRATHLDARKRGPTFGWGAYALAVGLYACALLSKSAVCTLPAVILVILWWKRARLTWWDLAPLVPLFAMSLGMAAVTAYVERNFVCAGEFQTSLSIVDRFLVAGRALLFYAEKLVWPSNLSFIYTRWEIDARIWWQYLAPATAGAAMVVLWLLRRRIGKGPLAGALIFAGTLLPVLGFFDFFFMRFSFVADHFQYIASMGLIALIAASTSSWSGRVRIAMGAAVLGLLGVLTWQQAAVYGGRETLWSDTLEKNPGSSLAHTNLGGVYLEEGNMARGLEHYREAVRLNPESFHAQYNLGSLLQNLGNPDEALQHYQATLRLQPEHLKARANMALIVYARGEVERAIALLHEALQFDPEFAQGFHNLGWIYQQQGDVDEAIAHYERATHAFPDHAQAHENLAHLYRARGEAAAAIEHWRELIRVRPSSSAARYNLGMALQAQGQLEEALTQFREALRINPEHTEVRIALGIALFQGGDAEGAMAACHQVLESDPANAQARTNLALMLLAKNRTEEAVAQLEEALRTNPEFVPALLNLGKVRCAHGRLVEGIALLREALGISPDDQTVRGTLDQALRQQRDATAGQ